MTLKKYVHNAETDVAEIVEMTSQEISQREAEIALWKAEKAAKVAETQAVQEAKIDAIAKLTTLGIDPKAFDLAIEEEIAPLSGTLD
jgi:hypothetical protein